jgi:hypothetical protein
MDLPIPIATATQATIRRYADACSVNRAEGHKPTPNACDDGWVPTIHPTKHYLAVPAN